MNNNTEHIFSDEYEKKKNALLESIREEDEHGETKPRVSGKIIAVAAVAAVLALSVGATVAVSRMNMAKEGGKTTVTASLGGGEAEDKPLRSWVPSEDEVAVNLEFGWLPDDITEGVTPDFKFSSDDSNRWITLYGYDLRREALDYSITDTADVEEFTANGHQAYIVRMAEIYSVNALYVMFEEDDLVVFGHYGKGISDDEIRKIAEGMTVSETTDVAKSLPIVRNDWGEESWYPVSQPADAATVVGETYTDGDGRFTLTVDAINVLDSFDGKDMADCIKEQIEPFVDENGKLIEYDRTEVIWEDGVETLSHFGETKTVKKKLVTADITYTNTKNEKDSVWVLDSRVFSDWNDYRIGDTRKQAQFSEPIYVSGSSKTGEDSPYIREIEAGETVTFTLGWLVDEDMLDIATINIFAGDAQIVAKYDVVPKEEKLPDEVRSIGETVTDTEGRFAATIDSITVAYSLDGIDMFDCRGANIAPFVDENGQFKEYPRTKVVRGDGVETLSRFGETEQIKKVFVTADITYSNLTDDTAYVSVLDSHILTGVTDCRIGETDELADILEPVYVSGWSEMWNDSPFAKRVEAGETVTYTLGWLVDEDMLDKTSIDFFTAKSAVSVRIKIK